MAIENAAGYPQHSGVFIPEIWDNVLNIKWYAATVYNDICNTDHDDKIKGMGDVVHIRQTPDATVSDYTKGSRTVPEFLESSIIDLEINKAKYFYLGIDSIDKYQSDIDLLGDWAEDALQQMQINIDTEFLGSVYSQVAATNAGATAGAVTAGFNLGTTAASVALSKSNITDTLVDVRTVLSESNVPATGCWGVISPWMAGLIDKSELKDASFSGNAKSTLLNGGIGNVAGFDLYVSNNLAVVSSTTQAIFGHKKAITFASQFTGTEYFDKLETTIGKAVRCLNVYGYKTVKSDGLARLVCRKA